MKKIISSVLVLATLLPSLAFASVDIVDVKLNGRKELEVKPGKTITVDVLLKHTRGTDLKCMTFMAFPDEQNRVVIEDNIMAKSVPTFSTSTFPFKVPEVEGNYDLVVDTYDNDQCNIQDFNDDWIGTDRLKVTNTPDNSDPEPRVVETPAPTVSVGASANEETVIMLQMQIIVLLQKIIYQLMLK